MSPLEFTCWFLLIILGILIKLYVIPVNLFSSRVHHRKNIMAKWKPTLILLLAVNNAAADGYFVLLLEKMLFPLIIVQWGDSWTIAHISSISRRTRTINCCSLQAKESAWTKMDINPTFSGYEILASFVSLSLCLSLECEPNLTDVSCPGKQAATG